MSGISILLHFVIGFTIFSFGSGKMDYKLVLGLAIFAAIGLYIAGPHPFLFGMMFGDMGHGSVLAAVGIILTMGNDRL